MIYEDLETALTYNGIRELESIVLIPKQWTEEEIIAHRLDEFVKINNILFLIKFVTN